MAIRFGCGCGRRFDVADDLAGRRTKCPGCGAGLTVPAPSAEDEAFRLLSDGPEPAAPAASSWREPTAPPPPTTSPQAATAAAAAMRAVKQAEAEADPPPRERRRSEYSGFTLSPAVAGGLVSMAVAGVWMAVALSNNRLPIYAPILFLFGLVAVVRGLLGLSED